MVETRGDIWTYHGRAVIALTVSGSLTRDGRAVIGRGVARQALERYPDLPVHLGRLVREGGNHVHDLGGGLVSFPVEESAWSLPDLSLIARSARELRQLADQRRWHLVVVPRPGCGGGGLSWRDVAPYLEAELDDRFVVITGRADSR
jgi:hypothetical protein